MYRPRPPKKWFISYIAPFLIIIIIFVIWIFSFQKLVFKDSSFNDTFAVLNAEKWSTEVMLAWKNEWRNAPAKMKLFKNDAIKTFNKWAIIEIPWDSKVVLDKESSLVIENIEADNSFRDVWLMLTNGRIWLDAQRMLNPKSKLLIKLDKIEFTTRWWVFSLESNWVRIIEWEWLVDIIENWKLIWHQAIWVWQELILSETDVKKIALWEMPEINAVSDEFKLSEWYKENYNKKEGSSIADLIKTEKIDDESNSWNSIMNTSTWTNKNITNNINTINTETWDTINNNQPTWELTIDVEKTNIEIKSRTEVYSFWWKVSSNTAIVHVNWWRLTKFKYWDTGYKYNTSLMWDNLKEWENIFKVQSYDKDYKLLDTKEIKINVALKIEEIKKQEWTWAVSTTTNTTEASNNTSSNWDTNTSSAWATLQVTSPAENEIVSWEPIEIKWIVPENTAKIIIWDYELKTFKKWDKTFLYRAASTWWNLVKWEKNTYLIKALDDNWNEIESIKFSFFAEKE